jgi:hypothetical protein
MAIYVLEFNQVTQVFTIHKSDELNFKNGVARSESVDELRYFAMLHSMEHTNLHEGWVRASWARYKEKLQFAASCFENKIE